MIGRNVASQHCSVLFNIAVGGKHDRACMIIVVRLPVACLWVRFSTCDISADNHTILVTSRRQTPEIPSASDANPVAKTAAFAPVPVSVHYRIGTDWGLNRTENNATVRTTADRCLKRGRSRTTMCNATMCASASTRRHARIRLNARASGTPQANQGIRLFY